MDPETPPLMLALAAAAGIVCLAAGLWQVLRLLRLARDGVQVVGRVYGLDEQRDSDGTMYRPLIAFHDRNGIEHRFRARLSESSITHPVGSEVPLRYLPDQPGTADLDTGHHKTFSLLIPFACGIVFLGGAIWQGIGQS